MLSLRCSTAERAVEHVMTESAPKYEGINPPAPHLPTVDSQLSARAQWSGGVLWAEHRALRSQERPCMCRILHCYQCPESGAPTSGTGDFQVEKSSSALSLLARPPHPTRL